MEQDNQVNKSENVDKMAKPKEIAPKKKGVSFMFLAKLLLVSVLVFSFVQYGKTKKITAPETNGLDNAKIEQIIKSMIPATSNISIKSIAEKNNLYVINLLAENGQEFDGYLTKDGTMFFPQAIKVEEAQKQKEEAEKAASAEKKEIVKNDKPEVELFVMSHCPYGTQIEKGILPAAEILGDKIDFSIKFVDYVMHGEKEANEQLNQYCIQKEQTGKYNAYLKCFLSKENNSDACLKSTGINMAKLKACTATTDKTYKITEKFNDKSTWSGGKYPSFDIFEEENDKYGVQGSPTLVINGVTTSSGGRDSKSLLSTICSAFTNQPSDCNQELSSVQPSPGFGYEASGNGSSASCGN